MTQRTKIMLMISKVAHTLDSVTPDTFTLFMEFVEEMIDSKDPNEYLRNAMKKVLGRK